MIIQIQTEQICLRQGFGICSFLEVCVMKDGLQRSTQVVSYFLWEYTMHDNALDLWYCAEDIAFYAEQFDMTQDNVLHQIKYTGKYDYGYVEFIRNISYRIYVYTRCKDSQTNWFLAEDLIENKEWVNELANMSAIYRKIRQNQLDACIIRSDKIRNYYRNEQLRK